jgi:hypothetical protein
MSGGMEDCGIAAARENLQIARNACVIIDGHSYKAQPWGIVLDLTLAPVFRAFARRAWIDDSVEYLWDVSREPSLMTGQALSAKRQAHYYKEYLKTPEFFGASGGHTLNLLPHIFEEAEALFDAGAAANGGPNRSQLQREFLTRLASSVNDYLLFDNKVKDFWKSAEFGAHHAANRAARQALRGRGPVRFNARPVVRFGKPK